MWQAGHHYFRVSSPHFSPCVCWAAADRPRGRTRVEGTKPQPSLPSTGSRATPQFVHTFPKPSCLFPSARLTQPSGVSTAGSNVPVLQERHRTVPLNAVWSTWLADQVLILETALVSPPALCPHLERKKGMAERAVGRTQKKRVQALSVTGAVALAESLSVLGPQLSQVGTRSLDESGASWCAVGMSGRGWACLLVCRGNWQTSTQDWPP